MLDDRKKEIFDLLCQKKQMSVTALAKTFYVSEMTVRRDLAELEAQGYLKRYRGGAMIITEDEILPIDQRILRDEDEKRKLAQLAAQHLRSHQSVYIDSSSTCQYIIPHIKKLEQVKIITNSIPTLLTATKFHIPCFLLGGEYYPLDKCFLGAATEQYGENINTDVAFFSSRGISHEGIISDSNLEQNTLRRHMMKNAKKTVFLFEKEKIGKVFLHTLCRAEDVDILVM